MTVLQSQLQLGILLLHYRMQSALVLQRDGSAACGGVVLLHTLQSHS